MDTRNLDRYFNINKVVNVYERKSGNSISLMELNVLLSIYHLSPTSLIAVERRLKYYNRTMSRNQIYEIVGKMVACGLIECVDRKYVLCLAGKNLVTELERRLRESRNDR